MLRQVAAGDDQALGGGLLAQALDAPLDAGVHQLGEEPRIGMPALHRERGGEQGAQLLRVVARPQVPVFLVGLAEGVAEAPQRGSRGGRACSRPAVPPGRVMRASSAAKARSSGTCSSMSTTATRSNSASAKGSRSPLTRCTSVSTSSRMESTASGTRSADAQRPPPRRRSRLTTPLSDPRSRQRSPSVGPEHGRDLGELALLQHRAPEQREGPGLRISQGGPPARSPASPAGT